MFKVYDIRQLANLLDISENEFHRDIKPVIKGDFKNELGEKNIQNPNIGLDKNNKMYLVDPLDPTNFIITDTNINDYI